jgi:zinc protease
MSQRILWRSPLTPLFLFPLFVLVPAAVPAPAAPPAPPAAPAAPDPAAQAASALYDGIQVHTLDNGLKVYLKPIPGSPVVTTMVCYRVGSCDEDLDFTGLSHYLEHLMFKGTDKIMPGDIDRKTLQNGGANNAYTSEDLTNYHFDFASDRWEDALEIEADRMRNLRIDEKHEFQQEKGAVIEELQRNEDGPWDLEYKAILPPLFGKDAPMGHPVIGEREHVKAATAQVIKAHYDKWYHPNNASLVVVGGFDPEKALAKIKQLFGPIPAGKLPERKKAKEPAGKRPARVEFASKFEVARLLMGYNTVERTHPDYHALAVLETVLSSGKTGRLYKKFVDGEAVASEVSASQNAGRFPGWFSVQMELLQGKDREKCEKMLLAELERLRNEPITASELKRAQQGLLANYVFGGESVHGLADSIAQGVTVADLDWLKGYLPKVQAITAADVQRVARKYLDPEKRVTVWSVPPKSKPEEKEKQGAAPRLSPLVPGGLAVSRNVNADAGPLSPKARGVSRAADGAGAGTLSLKDARRVELPNGLVLLLLENHRLPIFYAQAALKDSRLYEPNDKLGVAALTGLLLDEGTDQHSGPQIAEMIEDVGGTLSLGSGGGSVKVLSQHKGLGLKLLFECLTRPKFDKEPFERQKARQLSALVEAESQPAHRARQAFMSAVYGPHPFGRPGQGTVKSVEALTPADCAAFHKKVFVPNNTIVAVVGDFDGKQVEAEITEFTKDWKKAPLEKPKTPEPPLPEKLTEKIITMPEAVQLQFYLGHVGIRRNDPDFYKLLVMDYVLGTGPGFTDRLSSTIRDREGLAYTVNANISGSADEEPGVFTCYAGIDPKNYAKVKGMFFKELERIRDEKPKPEEVEDAKKYLLGSLPFRLTSNEKVAGELLAAERHHLGFNYLEDYRKAVAAVTPEDVQAVAKKHIDPKRMVLVAAGPIDASGKVIEKKPGEK